MIIPYDNSLSPGKKTHPIIKNTPPTTGNNRNWIPMYSERGLAKNTNASRVVNPNPKKIVA
jgi:hypothetical protein